MEEHGSHWKDFREILHDVVVLKYIEKFQVWLKLDNISSTLRADSSLLIITSPQNLPKIKKFQREIAGKIKLHISCQHTSPKIEPFMRKKYVSNLRGYIQ